MLHQNDLHLAGLLALGEFVKVLLKQLSHLRRRYHATAGEPLTELVH
jgi:hypothetical protein